MFKWMLGSASLRRGDCLLKGGDSGVPEEGNELIGLFNGRTFYC